MILKLLIDENVRREIFEFLKESGHDLKKLASGVSDSEIAKCAVDEGRIIVTHDLDFSNISVYPPQNYFGIVVIRISPPLASTIKIALTNLFSALRQEEFKKRLIILEPGGFRIRETKTED